MLVELLPPAFGGAARQSMALSDQLRQRGIRVFFASAQVVPGAPTTDVLDGFQVLRVPHVQRGKWVKFKKLFGYCLIFWRQRRDFEILHIHCPYYLLLAVGFFAQKILRKKVVLKLTSIDFDPPSAVRKGCYPNLSWYLYRHADAFVCMSTAQWNDCRENGLDEERLHWIPNGVDSEKFRPATSAAEREGLIRFLELDPTQAYGVFIGSIEENKGIRLLVEAAIRVCQAREKVTFLLLGPDGSKSGESHISADFVNSVRKRITEVDLSDRIRLPGRQDRPADYLRAASFFVFPSRSEGFGTVLIEAMAVGLPSIALNIPGVTRDIITHEQDGLIIENEDPAAFAAAILKVLSDPEYAQALGRAARASVRDRFDFSVVAQRYCDLYRQLLERPAESAGLNYGPPK